MSDIVNPGGDQALPQPSVSTTPETHATYNWQAIEQDSTYRQLISQKRTFIISAAIVFIVYYFGFLFLVGYVPAIADIEVLGHINVAYLLALSQFFVAWIIVYLYVRQARAWDRLAQSINEKVQAGQL